MDQPRLVARRDGILGHKIPELRAQPDLERVATASPLVGVVLVQYLLHGLLTHDSQVRKWHRMGVGILPARSYNLPHFGGDGRVNLLHFHFFRPVDRADSPVGKKQPVIGARPIEGSQPLGTTYLCGERS
jgi:hypothetical protein